MKGIQNTVTGNFNAVIGNNRRFIVPKFQRDYSWDTEQWDDLWQDIITMQNDNDEHYMGYLVLQTSDEKTFYIIDGQQRFTTIILLILSAIKNIEKLVQAGIEKEDNQLRIESLKTMYVGKKDPVTLTYDTLLRLNRNNDPYYQDYIVRMKSLNVRNLKATEKLMKRCFEFFEQRLNSHCSSGKDYAMFIQSVVDNLYFTMIVVNDDMNAFRVFETLNARGVQLSSSDLLKNYLFSIVDHQHPHSSYVDTLESKWAKLTDNIKAEKLPEFLRYYWNAQHRAIRSNEVFKVIRRDVVTDTEVFSLIDEMIQYSDIYMALGDENDELWEDSETKFYIGLLKLFHLKQPYSVLMSAKMNLDAKDFKRLLKTIVYLCFRYNIICDRNPNDQDLPFNSLSMLICREKRIDYTLLSSIMIEDEEFKNAFKEKSFSYNSRNAKIIRYILGRVEHYYGSTLDVQYDDENASIEHILPQDFDDIWEIDEEKGMRLVNRLGNMCLLEKRLNREIQNSPFDVKIAAYKQSSYYYAKKIAQDNSKWDESCIVRMQAEMAKAAVSIWRMRN